MANQEDLELLMDEPSSQDNVWLTGIIGLFAFCLIVPALSLLVCPVWCLCRCCKCFCCKRSEPTDLVTRSVCRYFWSYFAFIMATTAVMVVFSGIAYSANGEFSDVLLYRNRGELVDEDSERNLWDIMLNVMSEGAELVSTIGGQVESLKPTISDAINQVSGILSGASVIADGTVVLTAMLNNISDEWADYVITEDYTSSITGFNRSISFECSFCTTVATECAAAAAEITSQTAPIFADLDSTVAAVGDELTSQNETIMEGIDSFASEISEVEEMLHDFADELNSQRGDVESLNDQREMAYNVLFAVPLLPLIFVVIGGLTKTSLCFSIGYSLLWLSCVIMFVLLSLHLPLAVLMNDICKYLDKVDDNVTEYYDDFAGRTFQGCLSNERLVDILGLGDELDFTESIEFPTLGNVTDDFSFGALDSFDQNAQALDMTTFYGAGDEALVAINDMIGDCPPSLSTEVSPGVFVVVYSYAPCGANNADVFTRDNFSAIDPSDYYNESSTLTQQLWEGMANLTDVLFLENLTIATFTTTADEIAQDIAAVSVQASVIENDTQGVVDQVDAAEQLLDPVFVITDNIIDAARCGFIGTGYRAIHHVLCEDVMGVIARIVVSMLVVAVLSIVACCCSFKMVRKAYWLKEKRKTVKQNDIDETKAMNTGIANVPDNIYGADKRVSKSQPKPSIRGRKKGGRGRGRGRGRGQYAY